MPELIDFAVYLVLLIVFAFVIKKMITKKEKQKEK
jgi:hypothetical protein